MFETKAQSGRTIKLAFVVLRPPDSDTGPLIYFNRRIEHDGRGRVAIVERGCIDKRLEGRPGLTQRLGGAVELALVEGKSADHREHTPGPRIFDNHGTGNFRHLMQDELAVGFAKLDVDYVARADHLADLADRFAPAPGPLHAIEGKNSDRAFFADVTARLATRLQPDPRRLIADFEHHSQSPRRHVRQGLHLGKLDPPIAGNIDLGNRTTPSLRLVVAYEAFRESLAGKNLQLRVKRGANGKAALV